MKFVLSLYSDESAYASVTEEDMAQMLAAFGAFNVEAAQAGVLVAGEGLQPTATATTVTAEHGRTLLTDGPFAETKEQLGGLYVIDVADLDAALEWAAKIPTIHVGGKVEVRPVISYEGVDRPMD